MREEGSVKLRKQKKDDIISKKRTLFDPNNDTSPPITHTNGDTFQPPIIGIDESSITSEVIKGIFQRENEDVVLSSAQQVRKILSKEPQPPIDEVIASGAVPIFVELLDKDDNIDIQFEVAWILTNIASGTTEQTKVIVDHGAIPKFVRLLNSNDARVREQAVWAIGNIIGDGPDLRDLVVRHGFVPALLKQITPDISLSFLRNITWVIVNLCRSKEPPPSEALVAELIPALLYLVTHQDSSILIDTLWAISYISENGVNYGQLLIDAQLAKKIAPYICHEDVKIQTAVIRTLGSLSTGSDEQTQYVVDAGSLKYLREQLTKTSHQDKTVKESLWFLSNIAAGSVEQIQEIFDNKLLPIIIHYLDKGDFVLQREAAWSVYNISTSGSISQIKEMFDQEVIPPLCNLLNADDPAISHIVLDTFYNILKGFGDESDVVTFAIESCGGLDKIELLQSSSNVEIYELTVKIIEQYFNPENS